MLERAISVTKYIREMFPNSVIVWGGIHTSLFPRQTLQQLPIDAIVIGEGELTMLELANNLSEGKSLSGIKGLGYKEGDKIQINPPRELIKDLDELPIPSWHMINPSKYYYIYLMGSRGCPYRCSYCYTHKMWEGKYRSRGIDSLITEIKLLSNTFGIKIFKLWDDLPLGGNADKMIMFCERLQGENLNIQWQCNLRPEMVNDKLLKALTNAGCVRIGMGLETASMRMLKLLKKNTTVEHYKKAFEVLSHYKICTVVNFMLGLPTETREDIEETIALAREIKATEYYPFNFKPYPGTDLYSYALRQGFKEPANIYEWAKFGGYEKFNLNLSNMDMDLLNNARKKIKGFENKSKKMRFRVRAVMHQIFANPIRELKRMARISLRKLF